MSERYSTSAAVAHRSLSPRRLPVHRLLPLLGAVVFVVLWWIVGLLELVNPVLLPSPFATFGQLFGAFVNGSLAVDFGATVVRTAEAFLIAAVVGVMGGVALGSSERTYRSVEFLIDFFRSTPASALIPLFILFFGITDLNKVAIAAFTAMLSILFNSAYGVMNAKKSRILAARAMGASRFQVFKDVLFWESLPQTFVGLRTGISLALVIVIVAEMFIGTEQGLGQRIIDSQQVLDVTDMYASILLAGILGYALNVLFLLVEKRVVHWSGR